MPAVEKCQTRLAEVRAVMQIISAGTSLFQTYLMEEQSLIAQIAELKLDEERRRGLLESNNRTR